MSTWRGLGLGAAAMTAALWGAAAAAAPKIADLQWQRRVLLLSAPDADDAELLVQERFLADWQGAPERDLTVVRVVGNAVSGSGDAAAALRRHYQLSAGAFTVLLIGKDGHVALRSSRPVSGPRLAGTIDAMPMRQAGQR